MASNLIVAEAAAAVNSFRFSELGLRELIAGPITADLVRRGIRVQRRAISSMGQGAPPAPEGHPPAVRTGLLRRSITWRVGADALSPYVDVGTGVFYAGFVEKGTSRMGARPYLLPALEAARATF